MSLRDVALFFYSQLFVRPTYPTRSFAGETVIVTGSNVGLGKEAARHLARLGAAKVILAVRDAEAGERAKLDIEATTGCAASVIEVWSLDLSSYDSVKAFAARACSPSSGLQRIDAVIENAAVAPFRWSTAEGHELSVTVNVISTFLLALLLLPKLKATARKYNVAPRLSIVTSGAHATAVFAERREDDIFAALADESRCNRLDRYPVTKCLEMLLVRELAPKLEGSGVILNAVHPGYCESELIRHVEGLAQRVGLAVMGFLLARSTEVGSRSLVAGASVGEESHGKYVCDGAVNNHHLGGLPVSEEGPALQRKVWEQLVPILEAASPGVTKNVE